VIVFVKRVIHKLLLNDFRRRVKNRVGYISMSTSQLPALTILALAKAYILVPMQH